MTFEEVGEAGGLCARWLYRAKLNLSRDQVLAVVSRLHELGIEFPVPARFTAHLGTTDPPQSLA